MRQDIYARVTGRIIEDLESGVRPWVQPWNTEHLAGRISRPLRHNGEPYRGINVLMLWMAGIEGGYAAPVWMTYRQAKELGGHVRKGERGAPVVYANTFTKTEENLDGTEIEREIPFLKSYTVFNIEQIEGLAEGVSAQPPERPEPIERLANAEAFVAATGADIRHGGGRAFYAVGPDYIRVPCLETFRDRESYYATILHELTHWTRHSARLDRDLGRKSFGDEGYAREELVAELGAAFLCADLGITLQPRRDHADYVGSWLDVLKQDQRAIFTAAGHAERAVQYLKAMQPNAAAVAA